MHIIVLFLLWFNYTVPRTIHEKWRWFLLNLRVQLCIWRWYRMTTFISLLWVHLVGLCWKWKHKSFAMWLTVKPSKILSNFKVYLCLSGSVALSVMYGVLSYQSDVFISLEKIIKLRLLLGSEILTSTALKAGTIFLIARGDK